MWTIEDGKHIYARNGEKVCTVSCDRFNGWTIESHDGTILAARSYDSPEEARMVVELWYSDDIPVEE